MYTCTNIAHTVLHVSPFLLFYCLVSEICRSFCCKCRCSLKLDACGDSLVTLWQSSSLSSCGSSSSGSVWVIASRPPVSTWWRRYYPAARTHCMPQLIIFTPAWHARLINRKNRCEYCLLRTPRWIVPAYCDVTWRTAEWWCSMQINPLLSRISCLCFMQSGDLDLLTFIWGSIKNIHLLYFRHL